jgi:hypothetical protein
MMSFVLGALYFAIAYREAVTAQSPGLLQPWVQLPLMLQPQRGCDLSAEYGSSYSLPQPVPG